MQASVCMCVRAVLYMTDMCHHIAYIYIYIYIYYIHTTNQRINGGCSQSH